MRKSTIIATCLVNLKSGINLEQAELNVRKTFDEEFPRDSFEVWNIDIDERIANNVIRSVGNASRINVKNFIRDLW